jgi:hypothetical protein
MRAVADVVVLNLAVDSDVDSKVLVWRERIRQRGKIVAGATEAGRQKRAGSEFCVFSKQG